MKKICATILSIAMLLTMTGILSVAAEGEAYTYVRNEDIISEIVYQDFEELEPMTDYATSNHEMDTAGNTYGFYSFIGGNGGVMVTNDKPISGDQSIRFKDSLDARKWSIQGVEFDADAYVMEFKIKIDEMPVDGKFSVKISDVNSKEKDSENSSGPILSFRNVEGKIGLYNLGDALVSELEANKVYSVAIVCETLSQDYFVFLNEKYVGKYEFNVEFAQLSALRFDLSGAGTIVTMDDILVDGCELSKSASEATEAPTQEPTKEPTAPATATAKPAPATSTSAPSDTEDGGFPTWAIVAIAAAAVVVIAVVVVIVAKKKKK